MKLYARPGDFKAQKVLVAAQYANAKVDVVTDAKEKDLDGKAAANRLPLLETDKGCLFGSNAIMKFIAGGNTTLCGADAFESAKINSWIDFAANEIDIPAQCWTYPIIGWMDNYPSVSEQAKKDLLAALKVLEAHLKLETFLVGRAVTIADIAVACALVLPMKLVLDDKTRKQLTCVTRWFTTVANQPEFLKVVGPVTLAKKAVAPSAPAKESAAAAAAAPAKKEEPKKEEPKKPEDWKSKLDKIKSKFVMDAWKRQYSNASDLYKGAMPWFWENLDTENFTVVKSSYNYNDELKVDFQVSNLCGGFIQRCDEVRKYAFGVINIVGQNGGPMEIHGMWVIKGKDAAPIIEVNPDAEYHTWTPLELTEENKKAIADMWCAEEEVYGKPILDSKIFK